MQLQAAVIKEQGQTFAVVLVKPHVMDSTHQASQTQAGFSSFFPGMPVVLAAESSQGMRYYGRCDISRFLASISVSRIPWRTYSFAG